ncbi:MAG: hypothetical protein LBF56_01580 [Holosporales bacterium]|jgi:hypothetical protein|nr:hypothetical protein [Holosporales bacterium]
MKLLALFLLAVCHVGTKGNELATVVNNYLMDIAKSRKGDNDAAKREAYNKSKVSAMALLGVVQGLKLNSYDKMKGFCDVLFQCANAMEKTLSSASDEREELKKKRDITNYREAAKFLKCCSKLLDAMYADQSLINLILEKIPEVVPTLACEVTVMLHVLKLVLRDPSNIAGPMKKLRDFATSSEDGTHLMSQLISAAMGSPEDVNFSNLLGADDVSNADTCRYLEIR